MSSFKTAMMAAASLCSVHPVIAGEPIAAHPAVLSRLAVVYPSSPAVLSPMASQPRCGTSSCGPFGCVPAYGVQSPTAPSYYQPTRPAVYGWPASSYYGTYHGAYGTFNGAWSPTYSVPSRSMGPVYPTGSYSLPGSYYVPQMGYPLTVPATQPVYSPLTVPARTIPSTVPPTSPQPVRYPVTHTEPARSQPLSAPGGVGLDSPFYP